MATRGRRPKGPELVEGLEGSPRAKARLKMFLETITGGCTVDEACRQLGIQKSMFHKQRNEALQTALSGLEPRPAGRPPSKAMSDEDSCIAALEKRNEELEVELRAALVRLELAQAMPHLKHHDPALKKTRRRETRRRRARKRGRSKDSTPDGK